MPSRLVLTSVYDTSVYTVLEPRGLVFSHKEVMWNTDLAFNPFCRPPVDDPTRLVQVPHSQLDAVLPSLVEQWDVIGCLDTATYYYLKPLLGHRVEFLGPAVLRDRLDLLGPYRDPLYQGRMAAEAIHDQHLRGSEAYWDDVV